MIFRVCALSVYFKLSKEKDTCSFSLVCWLVYIKQLKNKSMGNGTPCKH